MNKLENDILKLKLDKLKEKLEEKDIFLDRNIQEDKKIPFTFVVFTIQRFLENYAIDENIEFVTDGSGDYDIDIFHIDDDAGKVVVNIFQIKHYKENNLTKTIGEKDIESFLHRIEKLIINSEEDLPVQNEYLKNMYEKFKDITSSDSVYDLHINLYLVTNGENINEPDQKVLNKFKDHHPVIKECRVINDYSFFIDKQDEESRQIKLPILGNAINMNQEINSKVVNLKSFHLAKLYEEFQESILEKNVRKLLRGKTNKDIEASLLENPKMFWYKNNGLSIVCRRMEVVEVGGLKYLELENPFIVNGGQTTKTIYNAFKNRDAESTEEMKPFYNSSVMARIYQTTDEEIINSIVYGTNNQNKITISDLKSLNPNLKKIKSYLHENGLMLLTKRDTEFTTDLPTISTDLLLQVYCSLYLKIPHKAKISKTKLLEEKFDEVYDTTTDHSKILTAYNVYSYTYKKLKHLNNDISRHGIFSIIYTMGEVDSSIKETPDVEKLEQAYNKALLLLEKIISSNKKKSDDFSAHNFFKSKHSTDEIDKKTAQI